MSVFVCVELSHYLGQCSARLEDQFNSLKLVVESHEESTVELSWVEQSREEERRRE